ncbi:MAG: hypothetical protein JST36_05245 [Bacteroidetes bacterium]|nr:hypothetical protein [Bacteroidota bacterium]
MRFGVRRIARAIARATIQREEQMVTFSEGELKEATWEHEDEFRLNGVLYDVAKITSDRHGIRHFHCSEDVLENALEARCDSLAFGSSHQGERCLHARFTHLSFDWSQHHSNRHHYFVGKDWLASIIKHSLRSGQDKTCSGFLVRSMKPPELLVAA